LIQSSPAREYFHRTLSVTFVLRWHVLSGALLKINHDIRTTQCEFHRFLCKYHNFSSCFSITQNQFDKVRLWFIGHHEAETKINK
jgi:hypothetical protein